MTSIDDLTVALERAAARPRFLAGPDPEATVDPGRLTANLAAINAEIEAPRPGLLARILARLGVDELTIPLVTATPGLRRSWLASVGIALFFALSAAGASTADGVDRIVVFLTVAPLVPLLGVALSFGRAVDPTHDVAVAAPMDGFRLFLLRATTVVTASTLLLLLTSLLVPEGGAARVAWLLPSLAATSAAMALATRFDPRVAAGIVAATWLGVVLLVSSAADASDAFGAVTQVVSLAVAVAGAIVFVVGRRRLDTLTVGS